MKRIWKYILFAGLPVGGMIFYSCHKYLDKPLVGSESSDGLASKAGVDGLLIGAYSMLDGYASGLSYTSWETSTNNWCYGGIAADDAYKGSNTTDQPPAVPIENHSIDASNEYLKEKFKFCYDAIQRANDAIREIPLVKDGSLSADHAKQVTAEAQFLRGFFHLEAAKLWLNVPYVSDRVTYANNNYVLGNAGPIWDSIAADFSAAMAVLPKTSTDPGRANYYAAEAFLAKTYMFAHQYAKALPLLTDLIANGTTAGGTKYALGAFEDNFDAAHRNNPESIFAVQNTVQDGSGGQNSDQGNILNFAAGPYTGCCGFYQPSYSLGNSYKVDADGLPMFQIDAGTGYPTYNVTQLKTDHGLKATDPFTPATDALDPRIDYTLGRRGIPYHDWGLCGGEDWSRGDVVPYNPLKNVFWHSNMGSTTDPLAQGWASNQGTAINFELCRLADVYLWRAECYVESNQLALAQADVDAVRNRMAAHPETWVKTYVDNNDPSKGFTNTNAANYKIGLYAASATRGFVANGQAYARLAVYTERQLELAMEGSRFFDLARWDGNLGGPMPKGWMATVLNAYIKADTRISNPVLNGSVFTANRNELYPLPQDQLDIDTKLKQNPGY